MFTYLHVFKYSELSANINRYVLWNLCLKMSLIKNDCLLTSVSCHWSGKLHPPPQKMHIKIEALIIAFSVYVGVGIRCSPHPCVFLPLSLTHAKNPAHFK